MSKITDQLNPTPELLGLSDVVITNTREARDGSIHITVKSQWSFMDMVEL